MQVPDAGEPLRRVMAPFYWRGFSVSSRQGLVRAIRYTQAMKWLLVAVVLLAGCGSHSTVSPSGHLAVVPDSKCTMQGQLPDPGCTPGAVNPDVTQANIQSTICTRGWTATVRPPVSYTNALKAQGMKDYGFTDSLSAHEEDHLIPLELGGSPADPKNLWPEPGASPNPKDSVEGELNALVCSGKMQLTNAQQRIASNWKTAVPQ